MAGAESKLPSTGGSWAHLFRVSCLLSPSPCASKGKCQAGPGGRNLITNQHSSSAGSKGLGLLGPTRLYQSFKSTSQPASLLTLPANSTSSRCRDPSALFQACGKPNPCLSGPGQQGKRRLQRAATMTVLGFSAKTLVQASQALITKERQGTHVMDHCRHTCLPAPQHPG